MKKIFSFFAPVLIILAFILVSCSMRPTHTGKVEYKTNDGRLSFTEVYGVTGDLQEKTVYNQDGKTVMIHIAYKDGKETKHEFFP